MNHNFHCPKCKTVISATTDGYACKNCDHVYFLRDGYVDFIGSSEFYAGEVSKKEMQTLIQEIDLLGYNVGLINFFRKNPSLRDYVTDARRVDWISHCLTKNNLRCLDIGSGLGNLSENLSRIYKEMYSLEAVKERIEFQKRRFKNSNLTNITIVRGNALELPFPDNYFDLVVCNGVLEWVGMMNTNLPPREAQLSFLREVKRVLSNDGGCLYIGIENRFGVPALRGERDHSGLPFTSLLPRRIANFIVKQFAYSGGVYGDKSEKIKEKRGYYTYTYSVFGYRKLLKEAGLKLKSYWVFPSYSQPFFSGRIEDKIGLKAFVRYYGSIITRFKFLFTILQKIDKSTIGLITSVISPSFLLYCYKNTTSNTIEDFILTNTKLKHFTTFSQGSDIMYVLYDDKGNPVKVAHLDRFGYDFPSVLSFYDKTNPIPQDSRSRVRVENWIPGRTLNSLNLNEINRAIDWLMEFQSKEHKETMSKNDIQLEVEYIQNNLSQIPDLDIAKCMSWLRDYEEYVKTLRIDKTSEHGDFWYGNILIDPSENKITVIDWQYYKEKGNPFFDFIFFMVNVLLLKGGLEEFKSNIGETGKLSHITQQISQKIDEHFGFKLNLKILTRYVILRFIIRQHLDIGPHNNTIMLFKKLVNNY